MRRPAALLLLSAFFALTGCRGSDRAVGPDIIFLVPGVDGNGPRYAALRDGLRDAGNDCPVVVVDWGAPRVMFALNYSDKGIHDRAEKALAGRIVEWRGSHHSGTISVIGHSAGCGVTLGALARLNDGIAVDRVILLAPSVSPTYPLEGSLAHVNDAVHSFHSTHDTVFLKWRTGNFGTYDRVKTPAAGNAGFAVDTLSAGNRRKLIEHPYLEDWKPLGNDGGHFGCTSRRFAEKVLAPLLLR